MKGCDCGWIGPRGDVCPSCGQRFGLCDDELDAVDCILGGDPGRAIRKLLEEEREGL